jgi:hypothetical protein
LSLGDTAPSQSCPVTCYGFLSSICEGVQSWTVPNRESHYDERTMNAAEPKQSQIIFIREGTVLPPGLAIETETFLPGWRILKNPDRSELTRNIEGANWHFFFLAGDLRAVVAGGDVPSTLRRAAKRIIARQEGQPYNSLEISSVVTKRFLGIPYTTVIAHSRHIQQDLCLIPATNAVLRLRAAINAEAAASQFKPLTSSP